MNPKTETAPVAPDELFVRLVWEDRVTDRVPIISPNAFEPRKDETEDISLFRLACLADATAALGAIAEEKRDRYALVLVPLSALTEQGLSVRPDPISEVPGHVVVPELNSTDYRANKARFTPMKLRLAEVASANIVCRPGA
jgi:hypothetical protein